jgi:hypothetical protein
MRAHDVERTLVLMRDICPFRVGNKVRIKDTVPFAAEWRGVHIVTGIRWEYRKGDGAGINISIASEEEMVAGRGDTDGWSPDDLMPA